MPQNNSQGNFLSFQNYRIFMFVFKKTYAEIETDMCAYVRFRNIIPEI